MASSETTTTTTRSQAPRAWFESPLALIPTPGIRAPGTTNTNHSALMMAQEMSYAHNGMLRALNSIWQQAPFIPSLADDPVAIPDFLRYIGFFTGWLDEHHHAEEEYFFPQVERLTGVEGFMEELVTQHHSFTPGLEQLREYAAETKPEVYDGRTVRAIVDAFAEPLRKHLVEEVQILLGLEKYDGPTGPNLKKIYAVVDAKMRSGSKDVLYPMVATSSDTTYEGGNDWPPAPSFVWWMGNAMEMSKQVKFMGGLTRNNTPGRKQNKDGTPDSEMQDDLTIGPT
ncbi:MAG: hypothetical protein M1838_002108 [Thelocarpon superellum]|nr:MAG: hypothetical protein M1838_002108 [Thelocarpon superellum]